MSSDVNIQCYPNPVHDYILLSWQKPMVEKAVVEVVDVNGKIISRVILNTGDTKQRIETTELSSGTYIIHIADGKNKFTNHFYKIAMNCIIIDPIKSESARLKEFLRHVNDLELLEICDNLQQAEQVLSDKRVDVVFIHVDGFGPFAFKFIETISTNHNVIITSGSSLQPVTAFELGVKDYLVKPLTVERLGKAISRLTATFHESVKAHSAGYFFVKSDNKFEKINHSEILYIEGLQNYITIRTHTKKIVTYSSLKGILSYFVRKRISARAKIIYSFHLQIDSINSDDITIGNTSIPISRSIRERCVKNDS